MNTPVKENFCKNLFQTPKSNQNEGNDFENDEIQMEVCYPSGKEIPQCDSESIEINDMIDVLPKVLKSLEDVEQKESFLKFMGLHVLASGTFPLHNICYLLFFDIVEWFSCDSTTHMKYGHETVISTCIISVYMLTVGSTSDGTLYEGDCLDQIFKLCG